MIVQILNTETSKNEWCLLEFQGEVLGDLSGNPLGRLELKEVNHMFDRALACIGINKYYSMLFCQDGKVEMDIGQHFLEGSIVTLKLPFMVVEKHSSSEQQSTPQPLTIEGFVKKKIIFKTRPKPIGLKRVLK